MLMRCASFNLLFITKMTLMNVLKIFPFPLCWCWEFLQYDTLGWYWIVLVSDRLNIEENKIVIVLTLNVAWILHFAKEICYVRIKKNTIFLSQHFEYYITMKYFIFNLISIKTFCSVFDLHWKLHLFLCFAEFFTRSISFLFRDGKYLSLTFWVFSYFKLPL